MHAVWISTCYMDPICIHMILPYILYLTTVCLLIFSCFPQELCDADLTRLFSLKLIEVACPKLRLQCVLQLARDIAAGLQYVNSKGIM